jgi:hypothetical protein
VLFKSKKQIQKEIEDAMRAIANSQLAVGYILPAANQP